MTAIQSTPAAEDDRRERRWLPWLIAITLFGGLWLGFVKCPVTTSYDSRWTIFSAVSYLHGENGGLARYQSIIDKEKNYGIEIVDGQPRNAFPDGPAFMATPFLASLSIVWPGYESKLTRGWTAELETVIASFYCALACVFMFAAVYRYFGDLKLGVIAALMLALATPVWSTASRALWQHGPVIFLHAAALWLLVESFRRRGFIVALGPLLAMALVCRPTAVLPAIALSFVVAIFYTRYLVAYATAAAAVLGVWLAHNFGVYHGPLSSYYQPSRLSGENTFLIALAGNLISPARGLFIFSPVLLVAFAAPFFRPLRSRDGALIGGCLLLSLAHLLVVSRFPHWWGGDSFGPRLMSDMSPLLVFAAAFPVAAWLRAGRAGAPGLAAFGVLAVVSGAIHAQGALREGPSQWNTWPIRVDDRPSRLWDWSDVQFLRPTEDPEELDRKFPGVRP